MIVGKISDKDPHLKNEEWVILNHLTTDIHKISDEKDMRLFCLKRLNDLIEFDCADFYIPASGKDKTKNRILHSPVLYSKIDEKIAEAFIFEYNSIYYQMDYVNFVYFAKESVIFKEDTLIAQEIREISPYYTDYLLPFDLTNVVGVSIVSDGICVGAFDLYRSGQKKEFDDRDLFILSQLEPHLSARLYKDYQANVRLEYPLVALQQKFDLTNREVNMIELVIQGKNNDEIASVIGIQIATVKKHFGNIYWKIGIKSRIQLINLLIDEGLIF
jgi:DNA-binding CsgD family transcriptional regulator